MISSRARAAGMAILAACWLSGCSLFNPYPEPLHQRPDLHWREPSEAEKRDHFVSTDEAIVYARSVEDAYRKQVRSLSAVRTGANASMIALATGALAVVASGGSRDLATGLGLGGGAIGMGSRQIAVAVYRSLYFQGAEAIECSVGVAERARPGPSAQQGEVIAWQGATLSVRNRLDSLVVQARGMRTMQRSQLDQDVLADAIASAERQIGVANGALNFASDALTASDRLGRVLVNRVEAIRIRVDNEIVKAEPDLLAFDKALKDGLESSSGLFKVATDAPPPASPLTKSLMSKMDFDPKVSPDVVALVTEMESFADSLARNSHGLVVSASNLKSDNIPADLFTSCSSGPGSGGPPRVEPATLTLVAGKPAAAAVIVSKGTGPYTLRKELLPPNVSADAGTVTSGGTIYALAIDAKAMTAGSSVVVLFKDANGSEASFVAQIPKSADAGEKPKPAPAPQPPAAAPPPSVATPTIPDVAAVQLYLKDEADSGNRTDFDPGAASGVWNEKTKNAVVAYLAANYTGPMPKPDFAGMAQSKLMERIRPFLGGAN